VAAGFIIVAAGFSRPITSWIVLAAGFRRPAPFLDRRGGVDHPIPMLP
jgi:hypothetical protein